MKTHKFQGVSCEDGSPRTPLFADADDVFRPARIVWESDWRKCQKAMKLVGKLAKLDLGNPDGLHPTQHWVDRAREIVGKEPK
jgi:hypothetical protein